MRIAAIGEGSRSSSVDQTGGGSQRKAVLTTPSVGFATPLDRPNRAGSELPGRFAACCRSGNNHERVHCSYVFDRRLLYLLGA
jgi:hypothetical protein